LADAQRTHGDRIRWFASLPWEYPDRAIAELARSCDEGAVGVMVIANIAGRSLTEPAFAPVWAEIDRRALPVLVHPGEPPGADLMDMGSYDLSWSVGFMFDTTLAFTRMIFDGFLDRYPALKLIAAHGGGTLPYLVGRFEKGDEVELSERHRLAAPGPRRRGLAREQRGAAGGPARRRPGSERPAPVPAVTWSCLGPHGRIGGRPTGAESAKIGR
jgi:aminocarboxymuconate-semialdehyde decarboxylase